jgi:hypothetical protein
MTASALGVVITSGWLGLAISSRIIGAIAGPDPHGIRGGLQVLPVFSLLIFVIAIVVRRQLAQRPLPTDREALTGTGAVLRKSA